MPVPGDLYLPFKVGTPYPLRALRAFEAMLRERRAVDCKFSENLRRPKGRANRWMGLRQKELAPLLSLSTHMNWGDDVQFTLLPVNSEVDVRIDASGKIIDLQFTLAAPDWGRGYRQFEIYDALNECSIASGYPPYHIEDGIAFGDNSVLNNATRREACRLGLGRALENKSSQDSRECVLAVRAEEFFLHLLEFDAFCELCTEALQRVDLKFKAVWIFDQQPGFIFRSG